MKKSIRTFALMFALTFVAATTMRAEVMGTNPRPQVASASLSWIDVAYSVLAVYGF
jgi:hypothetical protein